MAAMDSERERTGAIVGVQYLHYDTNAWTLDRAIAAIVHSPEFASIYRSPDPDDPDDWKVNFKVKLNEREYSSTRNDGTGTVTFPNRPLAYKFLDWVRENPIKIHGQKLKFRLAKHAPPEGQALALARTPYASPDIEELHEEKLKALDPSLRIDVVQFGTFYRDYPTSRVLPKTAPAVKERPDSSRRFSIEWESRHAENSAAWLKFDYDHKVIEVTLGDSATQDIGYKIIINVSSIIKIGMGYDLGNPYLCFDTLVPAILEDLDFHRSRTGDDYADSIKYKRRRGWLNESHRSVAPYATKLRLVLYPDSRYDDILKEFQELCSNAGLSKSTVVHLKDNYNIEAVSRGMFSEYTLFKLTNLISTFPWPVAFQLELLLHNGLLNSQEIFELIERPQNGIKTLCRQQSSEYVGRLLVYYAVALSQPARPPTESPYTCLDKTLEKFTFRDQNMSRGNFSCYHVTFTPTRMLLEGPYPTQSNRVLRKYIAFAEHFVRVDFRDEDRVQYRWDREVDGASFVEERVGAVLRDGFHLAGRHFEFLAYSNSALREHAVWYLNPFYIDNGFTEINADYIRRSLGSFEGTKLLRQPSKYAARIAQAFTATDPSVRIRKDQWEEVADLGEEPYLYTDGVGTISKRLAQEIWKTLCKDRRDGGSLSVMPSAYQIRFLGFKGMVSVDEEMDANQDNSPVIMRLRTSMKKFESTEEDSLEADIEIARSFERPNTSYLNRPLVTILENLHVSGGAEAFVDLQNRAVAQARTIDDSLTHFRKVLQDHSLGSGFHLASTLKSLEELGLELHGQSRKHADTPFFSQIRQVAMTEILREIKHGARIPVPDSYLLVGVADEGPAYVGKPGYEKVHCLSEHEIYACVQVSEDSEPDWLYGTCTISRSPVVHVGDIRQVFAIGKPPENAIFRNLKNVVVLPAQQKRGKPRSLASTLGGGDLDGDLYDVILHPPLLINDTEAPASYAPGKTLTLEDRECNIDDVCQFIVEYINSDVLGLLSDRLLIIADQSKMGIRDPGCKKLAALCSQAVDYPKQGIPVILEGDNKLPKTLIRCKPDWHAAEVISPRATDYYRSTKVLGMLFREITIDNPMDVSKELKERELSLKRHAYDDPISLALMHRIRHSTGFTYPMDDVRFQKETHKIFTSYVDELNYICLTHTVSNEPGVRLLEAEIVVGAIVAFCSVRRWRKEKKAKMRLHSSSLAKDVRDQLTPSGIHTDPLESLERAWAAWSYSVYHQSQFGANSFGLIALGVIFDALRIYDLHLPEPKAEFVAPDIEEINMEADDEDGIEPWA